MQFIVLVTLFINYRTMEKILENQNFWLFVQAHPYMSVLWIICILLIIKIFSSSVIKFWWNHQENKKNWYIDSVHIELKK